MFHFLSVVSLVLLLIWLYIRHCRKWGSLDTIPGPDGYPVIGHLPLFVGSMERITRNMLHVIKSNNNLIKLWSGPFAFVIVLNAKDAELILKTSKDIDKSKDYEYWKSLLGDSLFTISYGPEFKRNKKLILPSLSLNNTKEFFEVFNKHSQKIIEVLANKTGREFDILSDLSKCLMNILLETVLGYDKDGLQGKSHVIADTASRLAKRGIERQFKFWMGPDFMFWLLGYKKLQDKDLEYMSEVADQIINHRRKCRNRKDKKWTVFIDSLLDATDENGPMFSDRQIRDEVFTIIFAGQDTTSSALGFSLCLLGLHEDVQEKLYDEVVEKLGKDNSDITYEKTKELVYLDQVIHETLRLYPTVPVISKVALNDIKLTCGQIIPKNTIVVISLYHLQRNSNYFGSPDKFDPDNFTPERTRFRNSHSYIPFSAGIRTCVGQTYAHILLKVILAKIILNFKVYSKIKQEDFKLSCEVTLKRSDGFLVTLEPRE